MNSDGVKNALFFWGARPPTNRLGRESSLVCDAGGVEIILEVGEADNTSRERLVESRNLPRLAYRRGCGVCLRRMHCQP
jgi:hypothetical protein